MYDQPAATSDVPEPDEGEADGAVSDPVTVVQTIVVSDTHDVTRVLVPVPTLTVGAAVGAGASVVPAPAEEVAGTGTTETVWTTPGAVLCSTGDDADPPAGAEDAGTGAGVEAGATTGALVDPAGGVPPPPGAATPHWPRGLLPGNAFRAPLMVSWTGLWMLQEVDGSLSPPIRPGHLSIPESPASQLSMICWRVFTSQPDIWLEVSCMTAQDTLRDLQNHRASRSR